MFKAFHPMGLNPQGSTAEELDKWITNYSIAKEQKPTVGHSLTLPQKKYGQIIVKLVR
jgi:hypothetical protein